MRQKQNVVLYLDKELVEKTHKLGFYLTKTFENHLKQFLTQFSTGPTENNFNSTEKRRERWGCPSPYPIGFKYC
jgi:hypothetical protein